VVVGDRKRGHGDFKRGLSAIERGAMAVLRMGNGGGKSEAFFAQNNIFAIFAEVLRHA